MRGAVGGRPVPVPSRGGAGEIGTNHQDTGLDFVTRVFLSLGNCTNKFNLSDHAQATLHLSVFPVLMYIFL